MAYKKIETYDEATTKGLATAYKDVLDLIGEDSSREGLLKTPERVAKAMQFLTQGQGHVLVRRCESFGGCLVVCFDLLVSHDWFLPMDA